MKPLFGPLEPPKYKKIRRKSWELAPIKIPRVVRGYFNDAVTATNDSWALIRKVKGRKDRVWMSLSPAELESQGHHAAFAYGIVVVAGLGMGALVYNLLKNKKVMSVTVVEKDKSVIEMFHTYRTAWDDVDQSSVSVIHGDALHFKPFGEDSEAVHYAHTIDCLIADIWPKMGDGRALGDVHSMIRNIRPRSVGWWGQELDLIDFLSSIKRQPPLTHSDINKFEDKLGARLLGAEDEAYKDLVIQAGINVLRTMEYGPTIFK